MFRKWNEKNGGKSRKKSTILWNLHGLLVVHVSLYHDYKIILIDPNFWTSHTRCCGPYVILTRWWQCFFNHWLLFWKQHKHPYTTANRCCLCNRKEPKRVQAMEKIYYNTGSESRVTSLHLITVHEIERIKIPSLIGVSASIEEIESSNTTHRKTKCLFVCHRQFSLIACLSIKMRMCLYPIAYSISVLLPVVTIWKMLYAHRKNTQQ